jgi:hypothetical protein
MSDPDPEPDPDSGMLSGSAMAESFLRFRFRFPLSRLMKPNCFFQMLHTDLSGRARPAAPPSPRYHSEAEEGEFDSQEIFISDTDSDYSDQG